MAAKKAKTTKKTKSKAKSTKKKNAKTKGKKPKNENLSGDDVGIVVIEEDIKIDKDAELEARRAYLEEARSQEASSD